mmetsp:Transcript_21558/g.52834  ORF Transcript_21558/g.52834 Transcript_21558/m.52834 type:complete len:230 (+) Transcript_21558:1469-2158(+)
MSRPLSSAQQQRGPSWAHHTQPSPHNPAKTPSETQTRAPGLHRQFFPGRVAFAIGFCVLGLGVESWAGWAEYGVRSLGSSAVDIYGSVPGLIYVTLSGVWYLCYQDLLLHSYAHSTSTGPGRHADTLAGTLLGFWFLVLPVSLLLVRLAPRWHQLKLFTAANHMALIACWNGIATLLASSRVRGMLADRRSVCTFFSPAKSDKAVSRLDDGADDTRVIDFMSVSNPFKP